jgi:hypothetical protein
VSAPLAVCWGVQVGVVGAPVNVMAGLTTFNEQACSPDASDATMAFGLQEPLLPTNSRTLAQLAPDG